MYDLIPSYTSKKSNSSLKKKYELLDEYYKDQDGMKTLVKRKSEKKKWKKSSDPKNFDSYLVSYEECLSNKSRKKFFSHAETNKKKQCRYLPHKNGFYIVPKFYSNLHEVVEHMLEFPFIDNNKSNGGVYMFVVNVSMIPFMSANIEVLNKFMSVNIEVFKKKEMNPNRSEDVQMTIAEYWKDQDKLDNYRVFSYEFLGNLNDIEEINTYLNENNNTHSNYYCIITNKEHVYVTTLDKMMRQIEKKQSIMRSIEENNNFANIMKNVEYEYKKDETTNTSNLVLYGSLSNINKYLSFNKNNLFSYAHQRSNDMIVEITNNNSDIFENIELVDLLFHKNSERFFMKSLYNNKEDSVFPELKATLKEFVDTKETNSNCCRVIFTFSFPNMFIITFLLRFYVKSTCLVTNANHVKLTALQYIKNKLNKNKSSSSKISKLLIDAQVPISFAPSANNVEMFIDIEEYPNTNVLELYYDFNNSYPSAIGILRFALGLITTKISIDLTINFLDFVDYVQNNSNKNKSNSYPNTSNGFSIKIRNLPKMSEIDETLIDKNLMTTIPTREVTDFTKAVESDLQEFSSNSK